MADSDAPPRRQFTKMDFAPASLHSAKGKEGCLRWGLGDLKVARFRYSGPFSDELAPGLVEELLADAGVLADVGAHCAVSSPELHKVVALKTTEVSMKLFDGLRGPVVGEAGGVRQCLEKNVGGRPADDDLRKYVLRAYAADAEADLGLAAKEDDLDFDDETPLEAAIGASDRRQLLYRLFALLNVGGAVCQHDLQIEPYLQTAKAMYRDLVTVYRKTADGEVAVSTRAFQRYDVGVHPRAQFCFVLLEPAPRRTATILSLDAAKAHWW
ncbi:hypothetical protein M885DRAFT_517317 [Pelagophyceae sp. CCMP2097]|nr:hypothetical protein M885DRAFT_517317 [Pelagophyceae sp. CCMP2097]